MVIQFSRRVLESTAPGLSDLRPCDVPVLARPMRSSALAMLNLSLNSHLGYSYKAVPERAYRQFIRRTNGAARHYEEMRCALKTFFTDHVWDSPNIVAYFFALDNAEACLLHSQMAIEAIRNSSQDFKSVEPSEVSERICKLANGIKHFGGMTYGSEGKIAMLPVWFGDYGIVGQRVQIKFEALHKFLDEMIGVAEILRSPTQKSQR